MESNKFFHSVYLDEDLCQGCVNCIKRCPTEAIRVWDGKAHILKQFCIDCGECVRICSHHAKRIRRDSLDVLSQYEYTVALPPPSLYAQFNNLEDVNILLTALLYLGFDDVYEVPAAAEMVSAAARAYVSEHREDWPYISTACPTVVRLIRIRFPNLIDHLLPLNPPVEVAARLARQRAMARTGLRADQIGVIFLSPCPAKISYVKTPLGTEHSAIDNAVAVKDIYPKLLLHMKEARKNPLPLSSAGQIGVGWGSGGGESAGMKTDSYLAADGIENVIHVLEDLEDEKLRGLQFIELDACPGGCVGGVVNVENPHVAKSKLKRLNRFLPDRPAETAAEAPPEVMDWNEHVIYEPVFRLGSNVRESIAMVKQVDSLLQQLPGLDCGSCGAPTCRARAEDIVRGHGSKQDCIHVLKRSVKELTASCTKLAGEAIQELPDADARLRPLLSNLQKLGEQAALMDGPLTENLPEEQKQQLAARKAHTEETESPHPTQESQEETL